MGGTVRILDITDRAGAVVDVVRATPRRKMQRAELLAMLHDVGLDDEEAQAVVRLVVSSGDLVDNGQELRAPAAA
jgi:hypothetical protein